ncbi:ATP-binding protein [Streptomyces cinnabarinus]|uniref:ATP-binding protein n=1 Tax=Streptomyces cinnabarinus TaxID=67287 RepID=A0ABY7KW50_9ACTN|nr:ATP-binding protein [Streptomyces cinnabarinus]WAZ19002.1 ATP-binding protein [Streptomyces cinnabarinus]WAZ26966.1 ATP-binding protein [Streptomyces cinnabarinus]
MAAQLNIVGPKAADRLAPDAVDHVCPVPHAPGAVPVVRGRVRTILTEWGLSPDAIMDALVVVSELLTNALVHALPPATLRLSWVRFDGRGALRVEVTDAGPVLAGDGLGAQDPDEHGRGIDIVTALAARCGIRVDTEGITRWADLPAAWSTDSQG